MWRKAMLAGAVLLSIGSASAGEVEDLDVNMPNTLDDAFVDPKGSADLLAAARHDRWRRDGATVRFFPRLQWVPMERLQLSAELPYAVGSGSRANEGEADLGGLYQINREGRWLPAFAVSAEASTPVGPGGRSWGTRLGVIASRTVDAGPARRRLHVNALWFHRFEPGVDERADRYRITLGYSQRVAERTVLVANALRESQERNQRDATILEVGLRHLVSEGIILGGAVGTGIGRDSPRFSAILSVQFTLAGG